MAKKPKAAKTDKIKADSGAVTTVIQGLVIGTANVIPGVSGGTFAIIMGILERILNAVKSFNKTALDLVLKGKFKEFAKHTDLFWLMQLGFGMAAAIISLAKLLEYLFEKHPVLVWSFFFGLIAVSVFFVGKTVKKWTPAVMALFAAGAAVAVGFSMLSPAVENANTLYIFFCGMIAISAMILPGLSGSFMLIILGNYELIVINAISNLRLEILIPFALGCGAGIIAFSYFLSWLLKKFRDGTISTLTGFIFGSLIMIWPWKSAIPKLDSAGAPLMKNGGIVISGYERFVPDAVNSEVVAAILLCAAGGVLIWLAEKYAGKKA